MRVRLLMLFLCSFNILSARPTALGRYPQAVQYSILMLFSITLPPLFNLYIMYPVNKLIFKKDISCQGIVLGSLQINKHYVL